MHTGRERKAGSQESRETVAEQKVDFRAEGKREAKEQSVKSPPQVIDVVSKLGSALVFVSV